jgi:hypothetical protein
MRTAFERERQGTPLFGKNSDCIPIQQGRARGLDIAKSAEA